MAAPPAEGGDRHAADVHRLILPARRLATNGLEAWAEVLERGYEGYVGKEEESQRRYREGERGWDRAV